MRNKELETEIEQLRNKHTSRLADLLEKHNAEIQGLKSRFYEKCQKVQVKYSNVVDNAKNFGNAFITRLEK